MCSPRLIAVVAAAAVAPACSFMFDPADLPQAADGGKDGNVDATVAGNDGALFDAGPVTAAEVEPSGVLEGLGSSGPAIPVVIRGDGFAPGATISADRELVTVDSVTVSADGSFAVAAVRVDVAASLADQQIQEVTLTVEQGGFSDDTTLNVVGLDELPLSGATTVTESTFKDRYSRITVDGAAPLTGDASARLVATGTIRITQPLSADGANDRTPGAGGCGGGPQGGDGNCGPSGGRGATSGGADGGGGGGGHAGSGTAGEGNDGGEPGTSAGDEMVTPLGGDGGSRGHGGGGGVVGLASAAGVGGGGGGVVELSARGDVVIEAEVTADGGIGGTAGGGIGCGGGGGGGSGGAVLVRAGGAIAAAGGTVSATGGEGGAGDCDAYGGAGAPGRLRIDAPEVGLPGGLTVKPAAQLARGPMWRAGTPVVVRSASVELEVVGSDGFGYGVSVNGEDAGTVETEVDLLGSVTVSLEPGLNEVCLHARPDESRQLSENRNCRDIAYAP